MQERQNILRIFKESKEAIEKNDFLKLKELSNQTINTASRTQDSDNIATAVIIYSLGKIMSRKHYRTYPNWDKFYRILILSINNSISSLEKDDDEGFRKNLELIRTSIEKLSGKLKKYISDVFIKSKINKASRIYEHGISMEKTAKLLGITMFDLANYAGQKDIMEGSETKTFNTKSRIKCAMDIFK